MDMDIQNEYFSYKYVQTILLHILWASLFERKNKCNSFVCVCVCVYVWVYLKMTGQSSSLVLCLENIISQKWTIVAVMIVEILK